MRFILILIISLNITIAKSLAQGIFKIEEPFENGETPPLPNYTDLKYWAAHPTKKDMADSLPSKFNGIDGQAEALVDVFFIHPTIYTQKPNGPFIWNADVNDTELNEKTDKSTILNQATLFNGSCRVYAPRYRQAHYSAFTTKVLEYKEKSLGLAYADIKKAFEYYLENENMGRPIIIAGHSQGTRHGVVLLKEFFDGKPLQDQLVEAYLIGQPVPENTFENIQLSKNAKDVGGFVVWNTFLEGYYPPYYESFGYDNSACVNPISWETNSNYVDHKENIGGVGLNFRYKEKISSAKVNNGILWIKKPFVRGRLFIREKNWHRADINLFWGSIRENVALRINEYYKK